MNLSKVSSLSRGTLTLDALEDVVTTTVRGTFGDASLARAARRAIAARRDDGDVFDADCLVCNGDLVVEGDFATGADPFIGLLVVRGDLVVGGRFEDCLDPESIVVVTGSLRARDLMSEGFLEVHGDVVVLGSALFLENDGCAEIFGDLRAPFVFTEYHAVNVHGRVVAQLASGDAKRIHSAHPYDFVEATDPRMRDLVARETLVIEGDEAAEWWIDHVKTSRMRALVSANKPVFLAAKR